MTQGTGLLIENLAGVTVASFDHNAVLDPIQIRIMSDELYRLVDEQDKRQLVLDFSKVKVFSSQAIEMLLTLRRKVQAIKGRVLLCGLRAELHKLFRLTQIDELFKLFDTEKAALAEFGVHIRA